MSPSIEKNIKIKGMLILYVFSVFLSFYLDDFARFNPFVLLCFSICAFFAYPKVGSKNILLFALCSVVILISDILIGVRFMYTGISIATVFFIVYSFSQVKIIELNRKQKKQVMFFCFVLLLLFLAGMFLDSLYSNQDDDFYTGQLRYQGLFHAGNQSSSIVLLLLVLLWEVCKDICDNNKSTLKIVLVFILIYFFVYYLQSKTRTLWFALPYWAYQIFRLSNIKYLLVFGIITTAFLITKIEDLNFDSTSLRLGEDSSTITRSYLYTSEIAKITEHHTLFPKGSHTMTEFVVKFMGDDDYSPHNDFLRYFHDWGFVFIILLIAISKYLKHNLDTLFILLLYVGCALHNILFSPYVLFLMMFILIINYNNERNQDKKQRTASYCKEIQ